MKEQRHESEGHIFGQIPAGAEGGPAAKGSKGETVMQVWIFKEAVRVEVVDVEAEVDTAEMELAGGDEDLVVFAKQFVPHFRVSCHISDGGRVG